MADEVTRNDSEESLCDCRSHAWVCRTSGWHCCHCGRWQCTITGRDAIRDPEPFHDLKPVARRFKEEREPEWFDLSEFEAKVIDAYPDPDTWWQLYKAFNQPE
jgi:hypothetical protein